MEYVGQEMYFIKTYGQVTYEIKIEGDKIKIKAWQDFPFSFLLYDEP